MRSVLFWDFNVLSNGSFIQMLRDNLSVLSTTVKLSAKTFLIDCPQMLVRNYHAILCKIPKDRRSEA